jgi:hypothetical protein
LSSAEVDVPHGDKLSRKKEQAIAALLAKPTVQEAAAEVGISVRTLCDWLRNPAFERAYAQARKSLLERTVAHLLTISTKAVQALERNLHCGEPGPEIRAAVVILDHAWKGSEVLDLARRLEELENHLLPKRNDHELEP